MNFLNLENVRVFIGKFVGKHLFCNTIKMFMLKSSND